MKTIRSRVFLPTSSLECSSCFLSILQFKCSSEFPFRGVLVIFIPFPSPTPGISEIVQLGWVPPGRTISLKNAVTLYFYAKDNCFNGKGVKSFFYYVIQCHIISILPYRVFLSWLLTESNLVRWRRYGRTRHLWCHLSEAVKFNYFLSFIRKLIRTWSHYSEYHIFCVTKQQIDNQVY